ncbi:MAG: hypothetical protein COW52_09975 [Nitrospirae bacterium CG17_big_fil_post_rev_8_21_14_2_50_50_9]|nr:MAG: hypothetical protein COW52_09975 [Nitrospirae bacterium CG17_big_fil_post_rev_8_21_14_2_50_50_9]
MMKKSILFLSLAVSLFIMIGLFGLTSCKKAEEQAQDVMGQAGQAVEETGTAMEEKAGGMGKAEEAGPAPTEEVAPQAETPPSAGAPETEPSGVATETPPAEEAPAGAANPDTEAGQPMEKNTQENMPGMPETEPK